MSVQGFLVLGFLFGFLLGFILASNVLSWENKMDRKRFEGTISRLTNEIRAYELRAGPLKQKHDTEFGA